MPQIPVTLRWHQACSGQIVSETSLPSTYDEPTVMWTMSRPDGRHVQAVVNPAGGGASVFWLLNGVALGVRHFDDWTAAIECSDRLKTQYRSVGWRAVEHARPGPSGDTHD